MSAYIEDLTRSNPRPLQGGMDMSNGYGPLPSMHTPISGGGPFGTPSTYGAPPPPQWSHEVPQHLQPQDVPSNAKSTSTFDFSPNTPRHPLDPVSMSAPLVEILRHAEISRLESEGSPRGAGQRQQSAMRSTGLTPGDDFGPSPINASEAGAFVDKDPIALGWCSEDQGRKMFEQ